MKEVELTDKDYSVIKDKSASEFASSPSKYEYGSFLCKCVIKSFLSFLNYKDYTVRKGKIYESSSYEEHVKGLELKVEEAKLIKHQLDISKLDNNQLVKEMQIMARKLKEMTPPPKPMIKRD